jgi:hypothetical protein
MSEATERFEGGCLCGAVRFVATGQPRGVAWCHCESCRKHSGAPVSVFVAYDRTAYTITKGEITKFESTPGKTERGFCARCGSTLTCETVRPAYSDRFPCRRVRSRRIVSPDQAHISGGTAAVAASGRDVSGGRRPCLSSAGDQMDDRYRRVSPVSARPGEGRFTTRFADLRHLAHRPLSSRPMPSRG